MTQKKTKAEFTASQAIACFDERVETATSLRKRIADETSWIRANVFSAPKDARRTAAKNIEKWERELAAIEATDERLRHEALTMTTKDPRNVEPPSTNPLVDHDAPRIVCTTCPAVAKIHYYKYGAGNDRHVWIECHGEHRFGSLAKYALDQAKQANRDVLIQDIRVWSAEDIKGALGTAQRELASSSGRIWLYQSVVAKRIATFEWREIVRDAFLDGRDDEAIAMICAELGLERPNKHVEPGARRRS